jgi:DNA (cytosine-5)-methyltransferase 1
MRLLDLFCGAGGAAMGYHRAGFDDITGIDNRPMPRYPFKFIQADALEYLAEHGEEYDVIHASPPCQHYSSIQHIVKTKDKHPDLVDPVRQLLIKSGKPYVIENVVGAPLRVDLLLCGSMFGLGMIRHRIFESNIPMPLLTPTCHHENMYDPWHWGNNQRVEMASGMGIDWDMKREEVREAIPPAYTEYIGKEILIYLLLQSQERALQLLKTMEAEA